MTRDGAGGWRHGEGVERRAFLLGALALGVSACTGGGGEGAPSTTSGGAAPTTTVGKAGKGGAKGGDPVVQAESADLIAAEVLGRPTASSVTANVIAARDLDVSYEFGTATGRYTARTAVGQAVAGRPLETQIAGLEPGTRYYYRLRHGEQTGPERTFTTQRAPGASFVFTVQGDSHPERVGRMFDAGHYAKTLASIAASHPDFHVCIGDDFSVDALKTVNADVVRALYVRQHQWLAGVGAPVFLVNGNHEQASKANLDGTPDNVAVWAQTSRNACFPQPAPDDFYSGNPEPVEHIGLLRNYYAWTWGDALFVVIDPYWHSGTTVDNQFGADREETRKRDLWNVTLGETQYRWFERTLRASTARHRFVFAHHVNGTGRGGVELARTFEWGDAAQFAAKRPGWGKPIHDLMVDHRVAVYFQGHDHLFAHQELDGVAYQTLPNPANPNATIENEAAYRSGTKLPNSGYVRVGVDASGATVEYVRTSLDRADEVAHSYRVA